MKRRTFLPSSDGTPPSQHLSYSTTVEEGDEETMAGMVGASPRHTGSNKIDGSLLSDTTFSTAMTDCDVTRSVYPTQGRTHPTQYDSLGCSECPRCEGGTRETIYRFPLAHPLHYICNTNRLKATFGEVLPEDEFVLKEKGIKKPQSGGDRDDE